MNFIRYHIELSGYLVRFIDWFTPSVGSGKRGSGKQVV